jgi:hypothetical protein
MLTASSSTETPRGYVRVPHEACEYGRTASGVVLPLRRLRYPTPERLLLASRGTTRAALAADVLHDLDPGSPPGLVHQEVRLLRRLDPSPREPGVNRSEGV